MRADKTPEEGYHLENDMTNKAIGWMERQKSDPSRQAVVHLSPRTATSRRSACRTNGSRSTAGSLTTATTSCVNAFWRGK